MDKSLLARLASPLLILCAGVILPSKVVAEPVVDLPEFVEVGRSSGKGWMKKPTRTLSAMPEIPRDPDGSRFGGVGQATRKASGFFRTEKINGRWWVCDPEGHLTIHRGVSSVRQIRSSGAREEAEEIFQTEEGWATATKSLIKENGFDGLGAWSADEILRRASPDLVYTKMWNFMASYGKLRGGTTQKSGHRGYPGNCPFIFDPEFPRFCLKHAEQLVTTKDDPWLLGHFTDNELPWSHDFLEDYLSLPPQDPGYLAASAWLRKRYGREVAGKEISQKDKEEFLTYAADTYFSAVCTAIRKYDPNHLILGSRFHGRALRLKGLFQGAGPHLDVVSVNYYIHWTPDADLLAAWERDSGKPVLISEWYAKALDSGLSNRSGAGWLVKTQQDRAAFYQHFTLGLLESRVCVGWHWFRYADNDPEERGTDPSNRDANKGIVSNRYVPYEVLLKPMRDLNFRTYGLIHHFDRSGIKKTQKTK